MSEQGTTLIGGPFDGQMTAYAPNLRDGNVFTIRDSGIFAGYRFHSNYQGHGPRWVYDREITMASSKRLEAHTTKTSWGDVSIQSAFWIVFGLYTLAVMSRLEPLLHF
jgi:hypothetical protein